MLTRKKLMQLDASLQRSQVLSIYLERGATDPAERTAWRRELEVDLDVWREQLRARSHAERAAFDQAVARLEERLSAIGMLPAPGWVAFVTPESVTYAEGVPVPMAGFVWWGQGIRIAPYVWALEQRRPAFAAVLDSRMARIYRYEDEVLEKLDVIRAHAHIEPVDHMGHPPASGFHTGTRGSTGADEADRELRVGRDRLTREAAESLAAAAEPDGWILLGGIPEVVSAAMAALPEAVLTRARRLWSVDVHATEAEIANGIEAAVSDLRRSGGLALVGDIFERSASAGKGTLGYAATEQALRLSAVAHLCLTERFLRDHEIAAETVVREAFGRGAEVDIVTGAAADRLDADAGGIGARLRFLPYEADLGTVSLGITG